MADQIYDYTGPARVCHDGHVYYNEHVMREAYELPPLEDRDRTKASIDEPLDVIISGGSMGGLFAATAMRQAGHDATVYERTEAGKMKDRGAGIIAHPEMLAYLESQNIADWDELATVTNRTQHLNREGEPIDTEGRATYTTSWDTVYRNLRAEVPDDRYRMGKQIVDVDQDDDGVTVTFQDGTTETGDLLIVAEGYRSHTREQFLPDRSPEYAGYVAYRGVVPEDEVPAEYETRFGDIYNLYHAPQSQFLTYPVPGPNGEMERGERRINWVWYYPFEEGEALDNLLLDDQGRQRSHSLPPGLMREEVHDEQIEIASDVLPEQLQWLVSATTEPFVQCIYDLAIPELVFDNVCVIGDAAFFIRPHMAAGTAHAAADALELAESISNTDDLETALAEWETDQVEMGYRLVEEASRRGDRYTGQF
ncbi:FAD binding domain-containing protein [Natrinema ejinorense]|uniref:FAD-dependent monooxygenase n=1 Tax=Natrinema ejinorense TaxID=373386 RepID=A0A2A5QPW2_9EURY|nr:FAD-dependent monooxygenase [Natrinema ejinorense]PCR88867.1 FAD-dependent monooxygenase [Natrinema ejinorense]